MNIIGRNYQGIKSIFSKIFKSRGLSKNNSINYQYVVNVSMQDLPVYSEINTNAQFIQGKVLGFNDTQFTSGVCRFYTDKISNKILGDIDDYKFKLIRDIEIDGEIVQETLELPSSLISIVNSHKFKTSLLEAVAGSVQLGGSLLKLNYIERQGKIEPEISTVFADFFYPTFLNGEIIEVAIFIELLDKSKNGDIYYYLKEYRYYDETGKAVFRYDAYKVSTRGDELMEVNSNSNLPNKVLNRISKLGIELGVENTFGDGKWIGVEYIKNKIINQTFRGSSFGEADINASVRDFVLCIDRAYTQYYDEFELGKAQGLASKEYFYDIDGKKVADIDNNLFANIRNVAGVDGKPVLELYQPLLRGSEYESRINFLIENMFELSGYNPKFFLKGDIKVDELNAQIEENMSNIKQRRIMLKEQLESFLTRYALDNNIILEDEKIKIEFPDIMKQNIKQKTDIISTQMQNKLISIEQGVKDLNPLYSEEEVFIEVARIKNENLIDMSPEERSLIGLEEDLV